MRSNQLFVCLSVALILATGFISHRQENAFAPASWVAELIGSTQSTSNLWICYRKTFVSDQIPTQVLTRIAVDSKYWPWVNGGLAVREGGLKRGPTPAGTYFDELDLAPHLRKGSNTVAVLVWYFGKDGFSHNSSGRAGLFFEADLAGSILKSNASWKMKLASAFSTASAV